MAVHFYPAIIERAGNEFSVFFPDVLGCASGGVSLNEAARNAEEALWLHFSGLIEDNLALPNPSEVDSIASDPEVQEVARILVRVELPGKAQRINITMDESLLDAVDRAAQRYGLSRSGFLAEAARSHIGYLSKAS